MSQFTNEVNIANSPIDVNVVTSTPVAVTGPLTDAQLRATPVPISGSVSTTPSVSTVSTVTLIAVPANTLTTLLAANASRRQAILTVPTQAAFIKFGSGAASTSYTYKTPAANTVIETEIWTGIITVFGPAQTIAVTELS